MSADLRSNTTGPIALAAEHDAAGRHDQAVDTLAAAAQRGDVAAMTDLAKRLIIGDRAPHLPKDGTSLLADAAGGGSVEAALRLATLAALGAHVEQSWSDALRLLVFAAERGSESARGQLDALAGRADRLVDPPIEYWRSLAGTIDFKKWLVPPAGETLHAQPAVRRFAEFVTDPVCDWLIGRARGNLKRALIYDPAHGRDVADHMRTNTAAGFDLVTADVVQIVLQARMAAAVGIPIEHMEGPAVLHYDVGQQITNHFDFVNPRTPNYKDEIERRGERVITFLVYLNDDYEGGETDFPRLGVRYKGRRREALFFVNALPSGPPDLRMVHAGLPPTSGEKWIVSQFIRNRPVLNARAERVA